ncbi:type II secretion system protein N [Alisedimentitalea sp. MJ-SS2]|uniref:type II secretion system protein N n=1 Tax=Aliisedimentitalea sp. MJ-SS2 TaxID=3049795 RepID=UPI0029123398|nr:type II secretion system protein N [Alisedimentitalea sp. MJ-SS2]MDU8925821.1 type II secretion system protein N [Alisedimentitalea sp. MJ-SS2]
MRFVAALLTLIALTAAALAGQGLWHEVKDPPPALTPLAIVDTSEAQIATEPEPPRVWPALFGEPQPPMPPQPEPQPPTPVAEPQPPKPQMPPIESLGYTLTGLVQSGDVTLAMISHPTGQKVLRAGDRLDDGYLIDRIDHDGVWITDGQADPALLGFAQ